MFLPENSLMIDDPIRPFFSIYWLPSMFSPVRPFLWWPSGGAPSSLEKQYPSLVTLQMVKDFG